MRKLNTHISLNTEDNFELKSEFFTNWVSIKNYLTINYTITYNNIKYIIIYWQLQGIVEIYLIDN